MSASGDNVDIDMNCFNKKISANIRLVYFEKEKKHKKNLVG